MLSDLLFADHIFCALNRRDFMYDYWSVIFQTLNEALISRWVARVYIDNEFWYGKLLLCARTGYQSGRSTRVVLSLKRRLTMTPSWAEVKAMKKQHKAKSEKPVKIQYSEAVWTTREIYPRTRRRSRIFWFATLLSHSDLAETDRFSFNPAHSSFPITMSPVDPYPAAQAKVSFSCSSTGAFCGMYFDRTPQSSGRNCSLTGEVNSSACQSYMNLSLDQAIFPHHLMDSFSYRRRSFRSAADLKERA